MATAGTLLTSVVVLVALMLASGEPLPDDPVVVVTALACGVLAGVAYLAFFTALRHGPISVVSPVVRVYGGLTVVLSVLVLGESLDPAQALGVGVATTGILLASIVFDRGTRLGAAHRAGRGVRRRRARRLRRRDGHPLGADPGRRLAAGPRSWRGSRTPGPCG